jgi:hypothetical protein
VVLDGEGGDCVTRRRAKVLREKKERLRSRCEKDRGSKRVGIEGCLRWVGIEENGHILLFS